MERAIMEADLVGSFALENLKEIKGKKFIFARKFLYNAHLKSKIVKRSGKSYNLTKRKKFWNLQIAILYGQTFRSLFFFSLI
jgi:hypothetical protein